MINANYLDGNGENGFAFYGVIPFGDDLKGRFGNVGLCYKLDNDACVVARDAGVKRVIARFDATQNVDEILGLIAETFVGRR